MLFLPPEAVLAALLLFLLLVVATVGYVALGVAFFLAFTAFAATHLLRNAEQRDRALRLGVAASWATALVLAILQRDVITSHHVLIWRVVAPSAVVSGLPSLWLALHSKP